MTAPTRSRTVANTKCPGRKGDNDRSSSSPRKRPIPRVTDRAPYSRGKTAGLSGSRLSIS